MLHPLVDSGALQVVTLRPLHVRDCLGLVLPRSVLVFIVCRRLSGPSATSAFLCDECGKVGTRQDRSRKPELGISMLSTLS